MPWKVFDRRGYRRLAGMTITIRKSGDICLSDDAYRALGACAAVHLLHDEDRGLIGVQCADPASPSAYIVYNVDGSHLVHSRTFLQRYELLPNASHRCAAHMDNDGILVIDPRQGVDVTRRSR